MKRKPIIKKIAVLTTVIMCVFAVSCSSEGSNAALLDGQDYKQSVKQTPKTVNAVSFDAIGGRDVMPIGGYYGPFTLSGSINAQAKPDFVSDKYFKLMSDAKINLLVSPSELYTLQYASVSKGLDLAAKYKMGYFVQDSFFTNTYTQEIQIDMSELEKLLTNYMQHDAFVGVHTRDEPSAAKFEILGKIHDAFYSFGLEGKHTYSNLLPYYYWMTPEHLSGNNTGISYEEYVEGYILAAKPKYISYDHYFFDAYVNADAATAYGYFFNNLSVIKGFADEYKIPFWGFVQAGGQWNDSLVELPIKPHYPDEGGFIWNVNILLSYGAKGIQYFPLYQPEGFALSVGGQRDYQRNGIFGAEGNINEWYYYAQKANKQIAAADYVLMNAANEGVIVSAQHLKEYVKDNSETISSGSYRELNSVSGNAITGCFDYLGGTALYVTNGSFTGKETVTLSFDGKYAYDIVQRGESVAVTGTKVTLTLESGEGALVVLR